MHRRGLVRRLRADLVCTAASRLSLTQLAVATPDGTPRNRGDVLGKGVYHRGEIIAVEYHGEILLKADAISGPAFQAAGARRWADEGKSGKTVNMPYWSIPEDAFDDPEMMAGWVRLA